MLRLFVVNANHVSKREKKRDLGSLSRCSAVVIFIQLIGNSLTVYIIVVLVQMRSCDLFLKTISFLVMAFVQTKVAAPG